ncbi:MAG: hypothetical protein LHW64_04390 [Candidatus Cloacimonetes bacterium]|nr:hypothetical protein [Candidatus Cloacimonadota bacterium]MCB5287025.1 hypothetical protein [Candidatus Cloacimonadota bacterium]MCK9184109.1 hypothetical protein [Candidatus Cloacimonadota bacterium]MCK9584641.1 hypothetical protein [Candidatus Cloacimonadota bacterium]MDY0229345.1 YiiX/YebB-like N1pC/P60 family cysteine hydrolase [Candidatus Cloacimonadaceae bacterium]
MPRKTLTNRLLLFGLGLLAAKLLTSSAFCGRAFSLEAESIALVDSTGFEEGDILLRQGNSFISTLIVKAFPEAEGMSHCGILVQERGDWKVIHSISGSISASDGIRIEGLQSFVSKAYLGNIRHVKPAFQIEPTLLGEKARYYLNQHSAFDHDFDLDTRDRLYCSELIRAVYLDAGAEDVFIYKNIAGKELVDLCSFFESRYWH